MSAANAFLVADAQRPSTQATPAGPIESGGSSSTWGHLRIKQNSAPCLSLPPRLSGLFFRQFRQRLQTNKTAFLNHIQSQELLEERRSKGCAFFLSSPTLALTKKHGLPSRKTLVRRLALSPGLGITASAGAVIVRIQERGMRVL